MASEAVNKVYESAEELPLTPERFALAEKMYQRIFRKAIDHAGWDWNDTEDFLAADHGKGKEIRWDEFSTVELARPTMVRLRKAAELVKVWAVGVWGDGTVELMGEDGYNVYGVVPEHLQSVLELMPEPESRKETKQEA